MASNKRFKCPFCNKSFTREDLVRHVQDEHEDDIPEGYTALRAVFNWINYGKIYYNGKCTECGGPTNWDENKGRYDRQCGKKACHDAFVRRFENNMMNKMGMKRVSDNPEGQEYMLANRRISGKYKFKDGGEKTYTGSYEKEALKFLDQVMDCKSTDIITPGPAMQYDYNGEKHWYISDIYYVPYNLVIEVKDGGDKPNTRNMPDYRARQIAKEKHIIDHTDYNYLRLTNNDFSQLLSTMADLKMQLVDHSYNRVVNINENMFAALGGMFPMQNNTDNTHIVNYMQNNVFSGEDPNADVGDNGIAVTDSPEFDSVFYRTKDGKVKKTDRKFLENCTYEVYSSNVPWSIFQNSIKGSIDKVVDEGFLYEAATGNKYYDADQIKFDSNVTEEFDEYTICLGLMEGTRDYLLNGIKDVVAVGFDENKLYVDKTNHKVYVDEGYTNKDTKAVANMLTDYLKRRSYNG